MVEQGDGLAHEPDGSLVEPARESDSAVPVDLSPGGNAEVVAEVLGRGAQEVDLGEIALEGRLACRGMDAGVILAVNPLGKELVEMVERELVWQQGDELHPDGAEEALDLAAALGDIGPRVEQRDAEPGTGVLECVGTERRAIVDI